MVVMFGRMVMELWKFVYGSYYRYNGSVIMVVMFGGMVTELWKFCSVRKLGQRNYKGSVR